jgi:hypothetical protein
VLKYLSNEEFNNYHFINYADFLFSMQ